MSPTLPPNLERIGRELDAAWRPAPRRRARFAATLAGAAAMALLALFVTLTVDRSASLTPRLSPIEQARAALTIPSTGVFHVRIEFRDGTRTHVNEIWQSRESYRSTNTGQPEAGGRSDGTRELYDAAANAIYAYRDPSARGPSPLAQAYVTNMRRLLDRPRARIVGSETIAGVECVRIESSLVAGTTSSFYVDATTYRPVLERRVDASGTTEVRFRVWETLPDDLDSRRLSNLRLMYPGARVIIGAREFRAASARLQGLPAPPGGEPPLPPPVPSAGKS